MRFPRLRIGRRLFLSFLLVLAVLGMIVGIAVERLEAVDRMANHLVNDAWRGSRRRPTGLARSN